MRLPPELVSLVCAYLPKETLATFLRCSSACYALAAPHLYAALRITRTSFPLLMSGILLRPRDKVGWDLVPLSGVQATALRSNAAQPKQPEGKCEGEDEAKGGHGSGTERPNTASRRRKLALLAYCTELIVEEYPDLKCFSAICVVDWQGAKPPKQKGQALFPNVCSLTFARLAEPCLPGGLLLSDLGLAHPLLGLVAHGHLRHIAVHPGTHEEAVLRAACASQATIVRMP
ncbi:hypothetical protein A1Q2_06086 [Trichosporon asahii var. asahii CBS 8904]|uniref:F-box domain-containing protein n=2 Tax=Trichosporon asahii var. asahii TaxID=189963 RepID=K1VSR9_TRIAC|nr:hypothetical protein A1Q1_07464 [Trichosporon asahii var. asahii CBS 2479]EJT51283.1 hypothetical protein A1Q1_07464 [Trichosporon asahii var. asahii CBS 2479]EKC99667.1 hypothetical protein A1Q2_06086 [Trichosporon asahii var. asahii CBS 8904]